MKESDTFKMEQDISSQDMEISLKKIKLFPKISPHHLH